MNAKKKIAFCSVWHESTHFLCMCKKNENIRYATQVTECGYPGMRGNVSSVKLSLKAQSQVIRLCSGCFCHIHQLQTCD